MPGGLLHQIHDVLDTHFVLLQLGERLLHGGFLVGLGPSLHIVLHVYCIDTDDVVQYVYCIDTGVCGKKTPPEKNTLGETSFQSITSGAAEQFTPQDCRVKARMKGLFLSQTPLPHLCRILAVSVSSCLCSLSHS